ncbi:MAG TPA: condensation domain-containing protein, partial [Ktedonobacteraceae bacterium]
MMKQSIEDLYPLSPMQQGMLFHSLYAPEAGMYVEQFQCVIEHQLDLFRFKQVWQQLLARHPILRTSIRTANLAQPQQVVHQQVELSWSEYDYRHLSPQEQEEQLAHFLQQDRRRGFVFTSAPLMRLALFQKTDAKFHLVWSFHHLLLDGWSVSLLLEEIFSNYEILLRGESVQPAPVRPYREYIDWLQQQNPVQAEAFWRRELQSFTMPSSLAQGKPHRQPERQEEYGEHETMLSSHLTRELQGLARQAHLTLNTIIQGAWALLLNRYTRTSDIVFGVTVSGRPAALPGVESMIGLFINTLPLRICISPDLSLVDWLLQIQTHQLAICQYDYASLREIQKWSELPHEQSLFESLVVFENYPTSTDLRQQFQQLDIQGSRFSERGNYPLNLIVLPGEAIILRAIYDYSLFDPDTIQEILHHLSTLLKEFVQNAERPLSSLSLLDTQERARIVSIWNDTAVAYPFGQCFHQLFEAQVERAPEAIALTFGESQLTYRELNQRANQFAHFLHRLGIRREKLVGLYLERSLEMVIALLGVMKAGGAYLPLDPAYHPERLIFMLKDAHARVVITQQCLRVNLLEEHTQVVCLERDWPVITSEPVGNPASPCEPDNLAYVIYTSGSTGRPKGVGVAHRGLCNLTEAQRQLFALEPRDHV